MFSGLMHKNAMQNQEKVHFNDLLRERTMNMAIMVQRLFHGKTIPLFNRPMVNQVLRSSSSVAANFRAAARGRSDAEFYSKICIVVEECDETQFWLEYLIRSEGLNHVETKKVQEEIEELLKIFTSIKRKMKIRIERE